MMYNGRDACIRLSIRVLPWHCGSEAVCKRHMRGSQMYDNNKEEMKHMMTEKLIKLFSPDSVAVIGASNSFDKLGYHIMKSLVGHYAGKIYPINAKGKKVWELDSYPSIGEVPGEIDLAIIVVPAALVPETLHQCGKKGVKGAVLITAGFREIEDSQGEVLQEEIRRICELYELPIIGPNTSGFANIAFGVDASFTSEFCELEKGGVAIISQSGGLCHLCGFLAIHQRMGVSSLMSLGNRLNVGFPEAMRFFIEEDEATKVIALYIEGLDEPRKLLDMARLFRGKKPIIAYKSGKSVKSDSASKFHTGSLAGNHQIWKGAFRQAGILEVQSAEELIDTAKVLDSCALARGNRIAVLSGQAGPGIIAADALEAYGLSLSQFSSATQARINEFLPPIAIRTNPVDMGPAWYNPEAMLDILNAVIEDEGIDGVIFINLYASANLSLASAMAEHIKNIDAFKKPVISVITAPPGVWEEGTKGLDRKKGIAILPTPERAAKAMSNLWKANLLSARGD
ncbi:MAG: succinyl-CoA synthetase subunit alpha [Syntrophus sp. PtaU1.Bin208]|nr:MAG: succinyl-CoA synthetase subunit alpha [Syntrophus sp. PtaU1.Bin208]